MRWVFSKFPSNLSANVAQLAEATECSQLIFHALNDCVVDPTGKRFILFDLIGTSGIAPQCSGPIGANGRNSS